MQARALAATLFLLAMLGLSTEVQGKTIPAFARKYSVSCSLCHAPPPRLNAFGEQFAANGFEFQPGEEPRDTVATGDPLLRLQRTFPMALRYDAFLRVLTRPRNGESSADFQLPWVIKLLGGGQASDKVSYYFYFLMTERGEVAGLEDAYLQFTDIAGSGVSLLVGQFQISDPLFKRELRLEYEDYQPYRLRVGKAVADLTYDRGLMALFSPWGGADIAVEVVNGRGLNAASANRQYDQDDAKATAFRFSQEIGPVRLGMFVYRGYERALGTKNTITSWGPDATLQLGSLGEVNAQFLRRIDRDPFFGTCAPDRPCPGGATLPFGTSVNSGFAEAVFWPQGLGGRLFLTALYNWVDADSPVVSLRLGEQQLDPGYLRRYRTVAAGAHWLQHRNVRLMGELGWDLERNQARLVVGTMVAF
jgi:hypothetical protein